MLQKRGGITAMVLMPINGFGITMAHMKFQVANQILIQ
jgi:hypothetical protein